MTPRTTIICDERAWARVIPDAEAICRQAARRVRMRVRHMPPHIVIALLNDDAMRRLNWRHRRKNRATDVLSFAYGKEAEMGEMALALETLRRDAKRDHVPQRIHLRWLVVHGMLHLCGYDHMVATEAHRMRRAERAILTQWRW